MEREQRRLEETLADSPEDEPEVLKDSLAKLFKVEIIKIVKYLGDQPTYYMYTEQGGITIGPIANIYSQLKFREAVGAATSVVIPKVSTVVWETRLQAILRACEDDDVGEASHPNDETRTWVYDYLIERYIHSGDQWEKAAQRRFPFIIGNRVRIFLDDFSRWLDASLGRKLDNHALGQRLRRIKADPGQVHLRVRGARTTRGIWVLPDIFQPPQGDENAVGPEGPGDSRPDGREDGS